MDTLILSAAYEPMKRISWQQAMTLMLSGRVEIVEEYDDRHVRTVSVAFNMPSVVRFVRALKRRNRGVSFTRQNVYGRDKGRCQYCGQRVPRHLSTYDHVFPRSRGGHTGWTNIVIACLPCNQRKANRTPDEARMRLRQVPVKPKYVPDCWRTTVTWDKAMPLSWRQYLADTRYWNGQLESDD